MSNHYFAVISMTLNPQKEALGLICNVLLMMEISSVSRQYIRRLNMQCVDTSRDLIGFLKHERIQMLRLAKEKLSSEAAAEDAHKATEIQEKLDSINAQVSSMHYITSALDQVNQELGKLSKAKFTHAACGGCSEMLKKVITNFGYRLNALSAEVFFSDGVFLVEGISEV